MAVSTPEASRPCCVPVCTEMAWPALTTGTTISENVHICHDKPGEFPFHLNLICGKLKQKKKSNWHLSHVLVPNLTKAFLTFLRCLFMVTWLTTDFIHSLPQGRWVATQIFPQIFITNLSLAPFGPQHITGPQFAFGNLFLYYLADDLSDLILQRLDWNLSTPVCYLH